MQSATTPNRETYRICDDACQQPSCEQPPEPILFSTELTKWTGLLGWQGSSGQRPAGAIALIRKLRADRPRQPRQATKGGQRATVATMAALGRMRAELPRCPRFYSWGYLSAKLLI